MGGSVFAGVGAGVSVVGLVFDHAVFGRIKGAVFILMAPEIVREVFRRYRYGHQRALKPASSPLRSWSHKQGVQLHEQMFGRPRNFLWPAHCCPLWRKRMRRPIKRTSAPEGFEYYRVCDPEGVCHVVRGLHKVQRLIAEMPELIVTKMPSHWRAEAAA